ncbi:transposase [Alcaligenaceae bacterium]|nr:transposase [Alcaligenaceae bacterium]
MSTSTRISLPTLHKTPPDEWIAKELAASRFGDRRLDKRFERLVNHLWSGIGNSLPFACQDWANTKAAYRFLSNEKVTEDDILASHFQSTQARVTQASTDAKAPILILHDTTEFTYKREPFDLIGVTNLIKGGAHKYSGRAVHTVCGLLMHSSLAVTTDGLPMGLAAVKFWTRKKFKGTKALSKKINPTRVPIDQKESFCWLENLRESTCLLARPEQCVHIGDRGSDIYELFCVAQAQGTHFLIRTCVDRLAGDGGHTVAQEMQDTRVKGFHRVTLHDKSDKATQVIPP